MSEDKDEAWACARETMKQRARLTEREVQSVMCRPVTPLVEPVALRAVPVAPRILRAWWTTGKNHEAWPDLVAELSDETRLVVSANWRGTAKSIDFSRTPEITGSRRQIKADGYGAWHLNELLVAARARRDNKTARWAEVREELSRYRDRKEPVVKERHVENCVCETCLDAREAMAYQPIVERALSCPVCRRDYGRVRVEACAKVEVLCAGCEREGRKPDAE